MHFPKTFQHQLYLQLKINAESHSCDFKSVAFLFIIRFGIFFLSFKLQIAPETTTTSDLICSRQMTEYFYCIQNSWKKCLLACFMCVSVCVCVWKIRISVCKNCVDFKLNVIKIVSFTKHESAHSSFFSLSSFC